MHSDKPIWTLDQYKLFSRRLLNIRKILLMYEDIPTHFELPDYTLHTYTAPVNRVTLLMVTSPHTSSQTPQYTSYEIHSHTVFMTTFQGEIDITTLNYRSMALRDANIRYKYEISVAEVVEMLGLFEKILVCISVVCRIDNIDVVPALLKKYY